MEQELTILTTIWPAVFGVMLIGTSLGAAAFAAVSQQTLESIDCQVFPSTGEKFCYFYNEFYSDGTSSSEWDQYGEACRRNEQYFQTTYETTERVTKLSLNSDQEFTYIDNTLKIRYEAGYFLRSILLGYDTEWDDRSNKTFIVGVIRNLFDKTGVDTTTFGLKSGYGLYYRVFLDDFSVERYRDTQSFHSSTVYLICKARAPTSIPLQIVITIPSAVMSTTAGTGSIPTSDILRGSATVPGSIIASGIPPDSGVVVSGSTTTPFIPQGSGATVSYHGVYFGRPWRMTHVRTAHASSTPSIRLTVPILVTVMLGSVNRSRAF